MPPERKDRPLASRIAPLGLWSLAGWRIKLYVLAPSPQAARPEDIARARRAFLSRLAATGEGCTAPVLGFALLRPSAGCIALSLYWWGSPMELNRDAVVLDATALGPPRGDGGEPSLALEEIALLAFERDAWLAARRHDDVAARYLARVYGSGAAAAPRRAPPVTAPRP